MIEDVGYLSVLQFYGIILVEDDMNLFLGDFTEIPGIYCIISSVGMFLFSL